MTTQQTVFKNNLCIVSLNEDKTFSGRDLTDNWNDPRLYTKNTRSFKKGLEILLEKFNESTSLYQVAILLNEVKLNARTYCALD